MNEHAPTNGQVEPRGRRFRGIAVATVAATSLLAACSPPGGQTAAPVDTSTPVNTDVDQKPTTFTMRANKDQEALWKSLVAGYEKDHPNVTIKLTTEDLGAIGANGLRYLNSDNPPDLMRWPTPGESVKNGLLLNLDPFAKAYGWDKFPTTQTQQWQFAPDGLQRGSGSLYGVGLGYALVGVYYNKKVLDQLGLTVPTTLQEFYDDLEVAKNAGITPLDGGISETMNLTQQLGQSLGGADTIADWVFNVPGAKINDNDAVLEGFQKVADWSKNGYLAKDVISVQAGTVLDRFSKGKDLFVVTGSWMASAFDGVMPDNAGFFTLPPASADIGPHATAAGNAFVISAKSQQADVAASFLNWASTSDVAREDLITKAGIVPGGPANQPLPDVKTGAALGSTLDAWQTVSAADGLVDFMANATPSMSKTIPAQLQLLLAGKTTAQGALDAMQKDYEASLADR